MTKQKKLLAAILSVALVLVLAVGGTFAYLNAQAGYANNAFTFADNIRGELGEPNWDPPAGGFKPGMEVRKDPQVKNTSSNGVTEYVAIELTIADGSGTTLTNANAAKVLGMLVIDWNTTDWQLVDGGATDAVQIWTYKTELAPGQVTNPLFNTVKIKGDITDENFAWLSGKVMSHTPDCYSYAAHGGTCTATYKHHVNCAIKGESGNEAIGKGGVINSKTCDCTPADQHEEDCPSLIGTLKSASCHSVTGSINGFELNVKGAVVQASEFTSATAAATTAAFKTLFS